MCKKFFSENYTVYEKRWGKYGRERQVKDDNIMWRVRFAGWITKATDTHSEYVMS